MISLGTCFQRRRKQLRHRMKLGHKNPAITLQVKLHLPDGIDDAAAETTDQIMKTILDS